MQAKQYYTLIRVIRFIRMMPGMPILYGLTDLTDLRIYDAKAGRRNGNRTRTVPFHHFILLQKHQLPGFPVVPALQAVEIDPRWKPFPAEGYLLRTGTQLVAGYDLSAQVKDAQCSGGAFRNVSFDQRASISV